MTPSSSSAGLLSSACVLPVGDYGKIGVRLLSPLLAVLLLGLLCLIQLACRALVYRDGVSPSLVLAYRLLLSTRASPTLAMLSDEQSALSVAAPVAPRAMLLGLGRSAHLELASVTPSLGESLLDKEEKDTEHTAYSVDDAAHHPVYPSITATSTDGARRSPPMRSTLLVGPLSSVLLDYESTAVRVAHFSYNALATVCLAFFHTRTVEGFGRRLWSYPAIDTSSAAYIGLVPLMGLLLVVVVFGGPVALLVYLAWLRRTKRIGRELIDAPAEVGVSSQRDSVDEVIPAARKASVLPGALMTATFKPRFWFMSVVIMTRRLALILCLTFVAAPQAYTWLTLLNCAVVVVHTLTWSYRLERDNWMETFALSVLVVQTTLLTLYPAFQSRPMAVSVALWTLLVLPGAVMLLAALLDVLRYVRQKRDGRGG